MGFFSSLGTESYDRQYTDRQLIQRIGSYFRIYWKRLLWIALLLLLIAIAGALLPVIVSRGVDTLAGNPSNQNILQLAGLVLVAGVFQWFANWIRRRLTVRTVGDVVLKLRTDAFQAAVNHDLSFYDEFSSGRVVSRITSDTREFGQLILLVTDLFSQIAQAIILGVFLFRIQLKLSLYLFSFLPILFVVSLSFRKLAREVTRRGMRAMANVNAAIKETISGISIAKNFRQERTIYDEFYDANQMSYMVNVKRGFVLSLIFPVLNGLEGIGVAILAYVGGLQVIQGAISIGDWYLFLISLDRFFFPVLNLSAFWAQVQSGLSASERIFALIDTETPVKQIAHNPVTRLMGDIRFEHLYFRYTEQEEVFRDFNLHIHPGENLAIVGRTGAGKSSLGKLLARFYEFQKGNIFVDGVDIRTFDLTQYRKYLGIVTQTPFLFSGTILENITYTCSNISKKDIERLAMRIGNGAWLESLPNGLDSSTGERGAHLSMGQRQLVSLLRVLAQEPAIFILDEATASIDPFTEKQIQQALKMILAKTTSILIAHRLSTVKAADRIIVMEQGEIIEEGTHHSLLAQNGQYANLYNTYFRHQSLEYINQPRNT